MNARMQKADIPFRIVLYGVLLVALVIVSFPFLYVLFSSFATTHEMNTRGFFLLPKVWSMDAYKYLYFNDLFTKSIQNAVYITVLGTAINMVTTCLMAYGLSKSWLRGRKTLNFLVVFTMLFAGGIIPQYLVVKELHLLDTYWAIFLTTAITPFNMIVIRSFFQNVPSEMEESARIDGCGEWRLFWSIIIPLSLPVIATFTLFYAVQNWNTYFTAILYVNDSGKWPLQVFLRQLLIVSDTGLELEAGGYAFGPPVKMAAVVVGAVPMLLIYPFMQKYFNQGMLLGSVKG
jgi:putative aldouronate transport system permease protein